MSNFIEKYKKKESKGGQSIDFKELKAMREKHIFKCKKGKNNFIVLLQDGREDCINEFGVYNGLLEKDFWTIPADHFNKGEECPINNVIEQLKQDYSTNKPIVDPIDLKIENYALIVPINDDGEYEEEAKWMRIPRSIMEGFITHFENLEEDEDVFYDKNNPSKIIVNYDPEASFSSQYTVSIKAIKKAQLPTKAQYKGWLDNVTPIIDFFPSRTTKQKEEIITNYISKTVERVSEEDED